MLTTPFDFAAERNCSFRSFFSDPDEWANLFKVAGNDGRGLWRVLFPTRPGESDEQVFAEISVQGRLQKFFPKRGAYPVVHRNLYRVHQRVAASFRKGRVFLAGDAAHVNNPLGGLGLNCGLHDAIELAGLISAVVGDAAPATALDRYEHAAARSTSNTFSSRPLPTRSGSRKRTMRTGARVSTSLRKVATDPDKHRAFLLRTSLLGACGERPGCEAALAVAPMGRRKLARQPTFLLRCICPFMALNGPADRRDRCLLIEV